MVGIFTRFVVVVVLLVIAATSTTIVTAALLLVVAVRLLECRLRIRCFGCLYLLSR